MKNNSRLLLTVLFAVLCAAWIVTRSKGTGVEPTRASDTIGGDSAFGKNSTAGGMAFRSEATSDAQADPMVVAPSPQPAELRLRFLDVNDELPTTVEFSLYSSGLAALLEIAEPQAPGPKPVCVGQALHGVAAVAIVPGEYQIDLRGPYFLVSDPTIVHTPGAGEHVIRLARGASLVGRIVDTSGRPIASARVAVALGSFAQRRRAPPETTRAHYRIVNTDASGVYRIEGLVVGNSVYATAGAYGFGTARTANFQVLTGENLAPVLTLETEAVVQIEIRDSLGILDTEDYVALSPKEEFLMNVERRLPVGNTRLLAVTGLPRGEFRVTLHSERALSSAQNVFVENGTVVSVLLDILPACILAGSVTNSSNMPLSGASVRLRFGGSSSKIETNDQGQFTIALVPHEPAEVEVSAKGYLRAQRTLTPTDISENAPIHIVLERGAILRLELGAGVADTDKVRVECFFRANESQLPDRRLFDLQSDRGSVELGGFDAGHAWGMVMVGNNEYVGTFDVIVAPESSFANPIAVSIALEKAIDVHGLIVGRDDLPVSGANVSIYYAKGATLPLLDGLLGASLVQSTTEGTFAVESVLLRGATLRVRAEGYRVVDLDLTHENPRSVVVKLSD